MWRMGNGFSLVNEQGYHYKRVTASKTKKKKLRFFSSSFGVKECVFVLIWVRLWIFFPFHLVLFKNASAIVERDRGA